MDRTSPGDHPRRRGHARAQALVGAAAGRDVARRRLDPLVNIINRSDRSTERQIVEGLESLDAALAEEVRSRMFMFEDIVTLDDRSVQLVLRQVDNGRRSRSPSRASRRTSATRSPRNLSERAAENLLEEVEMLGAGPPARRSRRPSRTSSGPSASSRSRARSWSAEGATMSSSPEVTTGSRVGPRHVGDAGDRPGHPRAALAARGPASAAPPCSATPSPSTPSPRSPRAPGRPRSRRATPSAGRRAAARPTRPARLAAAQAAARERRRRGAPRGRAPRGRDRAGADGRPPRRDRRRAGAPRRGPGLRRSPSS